MAIATVPDSAWARVSVQSRIFEVVADLQVLAGSLCDLAGRFGVAPGDFLACLDDLVAASWVSVEIDATGLYRVTLRS
jgi:hypothetical protein